MKYRIIKLTEESLDQLFPLYLSFIKYMSVDCQDLFINYQDRDKNKLSEDFKESFQKNNSVAYIAKSEAEIAGFISGYIKDISFPFSDVKRIGHISIAYVLPEYRGNKVLKALEEAISLDFKDRGIEYIDLNVLEKNPGACKAWEKSGYQTYKINMIRKISP